MRSTDDTPILNDIHDLLEDSRKGYLEAAENIPNGPVKDILMRLATSRVRLISELATLERTLDPDSTPYSAGTMKGDLHRMWMDIREAIGTHDAVNMLSECMRGEEYLLGRYDDLLGKDVAPMTRSLALSQRTAVQHDLDAVKQLHKQLERITH